ncbi:MAG TPA: hypothetical protein VFY71_07435 [Planctomycetota bacterium]|nr:hypothetical protein [Planctomycetota bacterium]
MAGLGLQGAAAAAGGFEGLRRWLADARALQGIEQANEDRGIAHQRQQMLDTSTLDTQALTRDRLKQGMTIDAAQEARAAAEAEAAKGAATSEAQRIAEGEAQIDAMGLPPIKAWVLKASLRNKGSIPAGVLEDQKAGPKVGTFEAYVTSKYPNATPDQVIAARQEWARADDQPKAGPSEASVLANEMARLRIDAERQKQADAAAAKTKEADDSKRAAADAVTTIDRLLAHPGLAKSTGAYEMRGWTQEAKDFRAELNRFIAQQTKGNLGTLKGPMSDKDIAFIKQMSTTAADTNLSDEALIAELKRARAAYTGENGGSAPGGGQTLTRTQRNKRTGEMRTQTSTDGGQTWH